MKKKLDIDVTPEEVEVVGRYTADQARHDYHNDRAEFEQRSVILVRKIVTGCVIRRLDKLMPGFTRLLDRKDELHSAGLRALVRCLGKADSKEKDIGKDGQPVDPLRHWPGYLGKAIGSHCRDYLKAEKEVVARPKPITSNRIAPGSPEYNRMMGECEGRGRPERDRIDDLQSYKDAAGRDKEILNLIKDGWKQKEIADKLGLKPSTVSGLVTDLVDRLKDAEA